MTMKEKIITLMILSIIMEEDQSEELLRNHAKRMKMMTLICTSMGKMMIH